MHDTEVKNVVRPIGSAPIGIPIMLKVCSGKFSYHTVGVQTVDGTFRTLENSKLGRIVYPLSFRNLA